MRRERASAAGGPHVTTETGMVVAIPDRQQVRNTTSGRWYRFIMRSTLAAQLLNFLLVAPVLGAALSADIPSPALDRALSELTASDAEWRRNDGEFRTVRLSGRATETEIADFAAFVAGLRRRMIEDCAVYRELGGDPAAHGFDCVIGSTETTVANVVVPPSETTARTPEEKIDALDAELRGLEAELDSMLSKRQEALRERERSESPSIASTRLGASSGAREGVGGGGTGDDAGSAGGAAGAAGGSMPGGGIVSEQGASPGGREEVAVARQASNAPADVGDGNDDDVVARQLRAAADSEPDPVLREKLWDEYRKYKAGMN